MCTNFWTQGVFITKFYHTILDLKAVRGMGNRFDKCISMENQIIVAADFFAWREID